MKRLLFLSLAAMCSLGSWSCVPIPSTSPADSVNLIPGGAYVVCEGLWRQNNATLSYLSPVPPNVRDVSGSVNGGLKLGDNATDILAIGDTLYVAVNTSGTIERYRKSTGKWIDRIRLPDGKQPYRLAWRPPDKIYVSILNDDSILELTASTLSITVSRVAVGPAPEGLAWIAGKVFVANSGLGDIRASEANSGSISVLDGIELNQIGLVGGLPNVGSVVADVKRSVVWAAYRNLPSLKDSLGGVVCLNAKTLKELFRVELLGCKQVVVDSATGDAYFLHGEGISRISWPSFEIQNVILHHSGGTNDTWYSLGFDAAKRLIYVGNARQFVTDGEVIVVSTSGVVISRSSVGVNPIAFAF